MKNTFVKKFTVCALAGVLGVAFTGCDDSSSAGGDDNNVILSGDSREESSDSRSNDKDEAISSSGKVTDKVSEPAEGSSSSVEKGQPDSDAKSSDSKGNPSSAGTSTKSSASEEPDSSGSEGVEGSSASVPGGSSDASVYDADKNTLKDLRDGQVYKTTTIDILSKNYSEVWMAENLNFETENSWCYGDNPANCAKYGRLYTWAAAVGRAEDECGIYHACNLGEGDIRGACPKGWHLPSQSEWEALIVTVDGSITEYTSSNTAGTKLKSQTGWKINGNGTDAFGFSALPAGFSDDLGYYYSDGYDAYFWSSTEYYSNCASYYMNLGSFYDYADLNNYGKDSGFSVRCLKD